jgi:Domain of unknown function (DUF4157)
MSPLHGHADKSPTHPREPAGRRPTGLAQRSLAGADDLGFAITTGVVTPRSSSASGDPAHRRPSSSADASSSLALALAMRSTPCSCGAETATGSRCHTCGSESGIDVQRAQRAQPASDTAVVDPSGPFEREATTIADRVARATGRPQPISASDPPTTTTTRLPSGIRTLIEPFVGTPLDHLTVHAHSSAAGLAEAYGARAFTTGHDLYFGVDQYRPSTTDGIRLIAHEAVHAVQQGAARHDAAAHGITKLPPATDLLQRDPNPAAAGEEEENRRARAAEQAQSAIKVKSIFPRWHGKGLELLKEGSSAKPSFPTFAPGTVRPKANKVTLSDEAIRQAISDAWNAVFKKPIPEHAFRLIMGQMQAEGKQAIYDYNFGNVTYRVEKGKLIGAISDAAKRTAPENQPGGGEANLTSMFAAYDNAFQGAVGLIYRLVTSGAGGGGPGVLAVLIDDSATPEDYVFTLKGYGYFSGPAETVEVPDPAATITSRPGFRLVTWGYLTSVRKVFNTMKAKGPLAPPPKPLPGGTDTKAVDKQPTVPDVAPQAETPSGESGPGSGADGGAGGAGGRRESGGAGGAGPGDDGGGGAEGHGPV